MTENKEKVQESLENKVNCNLNKSYINGNNRKNHNFLTKRMRNFAAWGIKRYRTKKTTLWHKTQKEIGLTLYSALYAGNLPAKKQIELAKRLKTSNGEKASDGIFTRYSSTRGFALFFGLEYLGVLEGLNPLIGNIPFIEKMNYTGDNAEYVFWTITAIGVAINSGRYYMAKFKNKPFPAISWYSALVNIVDSAGKGLSKIIYSNE